MNHLIHKSLIYRISIQFYRKDNILINIQNRNQIIILENETNISSPENRQLLIVFLCQFFSPYNNSSAGRRVQTSHHMKHRGFSGTRSAYYRYKFAFFH